MGSHFGVVNATSLGQATAERRQLIVDGLASSESRDTAAEDRLGAVDDLLADKNDEQGVRFQIVRGE